MTSERKKKVCVCTHAEERAYEVKKTSKESEKGRQKSRKGTDLCFQSIVLALFYTCYFLHPVSIFVLHAAQLFFLLLRLISFILLFGYNLPARVQHNFSMYTHSPILCNTKLFHYNAYILASHVCGYFSFRAGDTHCNQFEPGPPE